MCIYIYLIICEHKHPLESILFRYLANKPLLVAVYKTGTGTLGLGDARGGTRGCRDVWARDAGTSNIGDVGRKVGGKCDISFFMKMFYL